MSFDTERLVGLDKKFLWHPFTPMAQWTDPSHEPLVLVSGRGVWLTDSRGRSYIDGNSSIWTNIHGHGHPRIVQAIQEQAARVAHTSFLGFSNPPAALLAERLIRLCEGSDLQRVFFSDNGSTAIEVAMKMAVQYWQQNGQPERNKFVAFDQAYHGDTFGAASLGGVGRFFDRFKTFSLPTLHAGSMEDLEAFSDTDATGLAAVAIEPVVQGVAGMRPWPPGLLKRLRSWCDRHGVFLIADEIMTGFGRTGTMFACQQEEVWPDFLCLAKGMTGGTVPLAATMVPERIYEGFLNQPGEDRTFYYGHSYTANQVGCAAALASLDVFEEESVLEKLPAKVECLARELARLSDASPYILETRQKGLIAGIELCRNRETGQAFPPSHAMGAQVCLAARNHQLLTRPIGDVVVFMPPLCISEEEIRRSIEALEKGIRQKAESP